MSVNFNSVGSGETPAWIAELERQADLECEKLRESNDRKNSTDIPKGNTDPNRETAPVHSESMIDHLAFQAQLSQVFLQRIAEQEIKTLDQAYRVFLQLHYSSPHHLCSGCCMLSNTWTALAENVGKWMQDRDFAFEMQRRSMGRYAIPMAYYLNNPVQECASILLANLEFHFPIKD